MDPPIKDVSGFFNEGGYYKANGLSLNEEKKLMISVEI